MKTVKKSSSPFVSFILSSARRIYCAIKADMKALGFVFCAIILLTILQPLKICAEGECLVSLTVSNQWNTAWGVCRQYDLSVTNHSSSALNGWNILLDIGEGGRLDQAWCCLVSQDGNVLNISNEGYNGSVPAGGSASGIGIVIDLPGEDTVSGTYEYNPADGSLTKIASGNGNGSGSENGSGENGSGSENGGGENGSGGENGGGENGSGGENGGGNGSGGENGGGSGFQSVYIPGGSGMYGPLTLDGVNICNNSGSPVQLRGVSTHGLAWFPQYVNEETFRALRDEWGVNLIRLAMYTEEYGGYCSGGNRQALEALVDEGVNICLDLGMYCIIDWHILSDGNPLIHKAEAINFFDRMSEKYASCNNVLYEICNEPNGCAWSDVKAYADEVIPVIRAHAPHALIICGTTTWSQDVDNVAASPVADPYNVLYAVHFYAATHGSWNRQKVINAINSGTPVFVSEFSTCDASGNGAINYTEADEWKNLITEYNLSYAGWNLANKDESSSFFPANCSKLSGWTDDEISDTGKWLRNLIQSGTGNPPVIVPDDRTVTPEELYKEDVFYLPSGLTTAEEEAFSLTGARTIVIAYGTRYIKDRAFAQCAGLKYVEIPDSVNEIAENAFEESDQVIFVCSPNSTAAEYAVNHGIEVRQKAEPSTVW